MSRTTKVEMEILDQLQKTVELKTLYDLPTDGASRAIRIASEVEMLMDGHPDWSVVNIQISKDADDGKNLHELINREPGTG